MNKPISILSQKTIDNNESVYNAWNLFKMLKNPLRSQNALLQRNKH